jgi:hypothetical protein
MKFRDLPVGATFRFFARGLLLTKTSAKTYAQEKAGLRNQSAAPDAEVIPEDLEPGRPVVFDPYGETNEVEFQGRSVRLDGVFTVAQLEAVLADMKKRKR